MGLKAGGVEEVGLDHYLGDETHVTGDGVLLWIEKEVPEFQGSWYRHEMLSLISQMLREGIMKKPKIRNLTTETRRQKLDCLVRF